MRGGPRVLQGRLLVAILVLLAACRGATGGGAAADREGRATVAPSVRLRVMTFNIAAGGVDLARVERTIRDAGVDVAALQEVDVHWSARSGFADQAAALAAGLGMDVRFAPIYRLPGADSTRPMREFGVALLSRFPVRSFRNHSITRLSTQDAGAKPAPAPGFLEATVDVRGVLLRLFDTHLDYRADPAVRVAQVGEMLAIIGEAALPTILFGDLNATPDAPELQPLFRRLRDLWPGDGGPGLTYPAAAPVKRIDYVLGSPQVRVTAMRTVPSDASDHRAVVADVVVSGGRSSN